MFCPKCAQQQSSDEVRFCSRCGFQLGVVKAALAADDVLETRAAAAPPDRKLRKRDMSVGAALMFFAAFVVTVTTMDMPAAYSGRIFLLVIAWLALTVLLNIRPLVRYFVGDGASRAAHDASTPKHAHDLTTKVSASSRHAALPPANAEAVPASAFGTHRVNTAEVARPPSVTEHTTNLLGDR